MKQNTAAKNKVEKWGWAVLLFPLLLNSDLLLYYSTTSNNNFLKNNYYNTTFISIALLYFSQSISHP